MQEVANSITNYLRKFSEPPKQRSVKWYKLRQNKIGSSEIATLLGWNYFSSYAGLLWKKIENTELSSVPCKWGILFEPVLKQIIENQLNTTIYGNNSVILGKHVGFDLCITSPDGYCPLPLKYKNGKLEIKFINDNEPINKIVPALIEMKCPYKRRPTKKIPRMYLPQLWSGLSLAKFAEMGLFIDAVFRICSLEDLGPLSSYNYKIHYVKPQYTTPIAWGLFVYMEILNIYQ